MSGGQVFGGHVSDGQVSGGQVCPVVRCLVVRCPPRERQTWVRFLVSPWVPF